MNALFVAEYADVEAASHAHDKLCDLGDVDFEIYSSTPLHQSNGDHMRPKRQVSWIMAVAALIGAALSIGTQYWTTQISYPLQIGERGVGWPAYIPASIALAMFWGALGAMTAFFGHAKLPRFNNPIFDAQAYHRVQYGAVLIAVKCGGDAAEQAIKFLKSGKGLQSTQLLKPEHEAEAR